MGPIPITCSSIDQCCKRCWTKVGKHIRSQSTVFGVFVDKWPSCYTRVCGQCKLCHSFLLSILECNCCVDIFSWLERPLFFFKKKKTFHDVIKVSFQAYQAGLIVCNFFLRDFALTRLENIHHFLNLYDNVWFNVIWHGWSVVTLTLMKLSSKWCHCMPSVMCGLSSLVI